MKKIINILLLVIVTISFFACAKANEIPAVETTESSGENLAFASVELEIKDIEKKANELNENLNNATSQTDMNIIQNDIYELWDKELNSLWARIKEKSDKDAMKKLTEEENIWIKEKEDEIKKTASLFDGGSIQALEVGSVAASLTRERVYHLGNILANLLGEPEFFALES